MKKWLVVLKIVLVIILSFTVIWYLFADNGPLHDSNIAHVIQERINGANQVEEIQPTEEPIEVEDIAEEQEESEPVNPNATIVFTGDVELSEYIQANYDANGVDGVVSQEIKSLMTDATVTMINNEFCFSTRGEKAADKQYTFRVDPSYVKLLTDLGVDVAGLANNHSIDYGREALTDTFVTLSDAGIEYTGAGNDLDDSAKLIIKTDDMGRRYGFLASSRVIPFGSWNVVNAQPGVYTCYDDADLVERVRMAKEQVDYLYVMVHWGVEHTEQLEPHQIQIGHDLVDAGADAVIGMHSHCLQPVELYNGCPIFYSLGNFIFNQNIKSGAAVAISYDGENNQTIRIVPIVATGACTEPAANTNPNIYSYIANMSDTVQIDNEGYISSR